MNLYQLKAFYYTGKFGSVSRAAKELYITQPAATKHIQKLQKFYNISTLILIFLFFRQEYFYNLKCGLATLVP